MPVGPTAGPIGGPPLALPPVTKALTTTLPFSLIFVQSSNYFKCNSKRLKDIKINIISYT
jgi:hypothetical protein